MGIFKKKFSQIFTVSFTAEVFNVPDDNKKFKVFQSNSSFCDEM